MQLRQHKVPEETLRANPIFKYSPHLAGRLTRAGIDATQPMLAAAFSFAIQHGGLLEQDFVRDPEVSFNPRPARVGLILLNDVGTRDTELFAAAFLCCGDPGAFDEVGAQPELEGPVALARRALSGPRALRSTGTGDRAAVECALVLHLDRARHRHQAQSPEAQCEWPSFLKETESYLELARSNQHPLYRLLDHWYRRAANSAPAER